MTRCQKRPKNKMDMGTSIDGYSNHSASTEPPCPPFERFGYVPESFGLLPCGKQGIIAIMIHRQVNHMPQLVEL